MNTKYNIMNLLEVLYNTFEGIGTKIYVTSRPSKEDTHSDDFIVVSFPNRVRDNLGVGETMCRIDLYAKDLQNGIENLIRLSQMQTEVYNKLPISTDSYIINNPQTIQRGRDTLGFHCVSIICNVLIY